jgi:hypothetical protein
MSSQQNSQLRFWCHQCRKRINPLQDFTCPTCKGAFIEEIENDSDLFRLYSESNTQQQQQQENRQQNPNVHQFFSFSINQNFNTQPNGDFFQVFMNGRPQQQQMPFGYVQ